MTTSVEVVAIGKSAGVILPEDLLIKLGVSVGDDIVIMESRDGLTLSPLDAHIARQMAVAEMIMHKDRDMLRKLVD